MNPGRDGFQMAINSEIFVDKTEMIQYLNSVVNTQQRFVSVSRPRRFGKTMAADMLCAYYGSGADSRELFSRRKLASCPPAEAAGREIRWDAYLGKFDVIRLVMTRFFKTKTTVEESLDRLQRLVARDIRRAYPEVDLFDEFRTSTKSEEWVDTLRSFENQRELLKATWNRQAERVAELLEDAHNRAGNRTYNNEAALSYAVQYAYYAAQKYYTTILELDSGKGYADIAYLPSPEYPDKPALVVELKHDKSADTAMSQIKRQQYPDRLEHYRGNILLVAIDYDRDVPSTSPGFKHHTCRIELAQLGQWVSWEQGKPSLTMSGLARVAAV